MPRHILSEFNAERTCEGSRSCDQAAIAVGGSQGVTAQVQWWTLAQLARGGAPELHHSADTEQKGRLN